MLAALAGGTAAAQATTEKIAIAMFGPHPSLQQVSEGFKEQLAAEGVVASYDEGNVNFDRSLVPQPLPVTFSTREDHVMRISAPHMKRLGLTLPDGLKGCGCVAE